MYEREGRNSDRLLCFVSFIKKISNVFRSSENCIRKSHVPITHFSACQVGQSCYIYIPTPSYPDYFETDFRMALYIIHTYYLSSLISRPHGCLFNEEQRRKGGNLEGND